MKNQSKSIYVVAAAAVAITVALVIYFNQHNTSKTETKKTDSLSTVRVIFPKKTDAKVKFIFSARIYPIEEAQLYARAAGFVQSRSVDIGDKVKAGDLLAVLSSPELEEKIKQAEATVKLQIARVKLAKIELDRFASLVPKGAASQSLYDQSLASYQVAQATLELNQAQLMQLQKEFDYTKIIAPFDGLISQRNVEKGDRIAANDTKSLFKLIRIDQLRVVVDIPQTQLYAIKKQGVVNLEFAEYPNKVYTARYSRMSNEVDLNSGTMRVEFILDNTQSLPAGLTGEVTFNLSDDAKILLIPTNALSVRDGRSSVVMVKEDNRIMYRQVQAGRMHGSEVEILSGLTAQDRVVINPNSMLLPNQLVNIAVEKQ